MAYRNVYIKNNVNISVKNEQLCIIKDEEIHTIPLEDINSIMIENNKSIITTYTLMKLIEHKVVCYICDEKHLPTGVLLGINNFNKQLKILNEQINITKPLQKNLWKSIIKMKIENQANCLQLLEYNGYNKLLNFVENVNSGDTNNIESTAASEYFKILFNNEFTRRNRNKTNAALNYAYAIIRSTIARTLISHGLEPALGLFHHNQLNNFNLADDLIEPFRAIVDYYIFLKLPLENENDLNTEDKKIIYDLTNMLVTIDDKKYNIQNSIECMVISLIKSIKSNKDYIKLPKILKYERYRYE